MQIKSGGLTLGLVGFVCAAGGYADAAETQVHRIAWGALTRTHTLQFMLQELDRALVPGLRTDVLSLPLSGSPNPFLVTSKDFYTGDYLMLPQDGRAGPVPSISPRDAAWFDGVVADDKLPDVFLIGGHNVISEGFHDDAEDHFIYLPTLLDTVDRYPGARRMFENIKLAVVWGCNTMTNLEPHGPNGEYLSPAQIRRLYDSGPAGRSRVIGHASQNNTLEFYKSRLAREYGPGRPHYEYTRDAAAEECDPGYRNCRVTNLERIMPESGLYDGSHRYNHPYMTKRLFPNAYLVLGYSSASPHEEQRMPIFKSALARAQAALNQGVRMGDPRYVDNVLATILSDETTEHERKRVIEALRSAWTAVTLKKVMLPSGSITPAYPELDANGIFNNPVSREAPLYAPYEDRGHRHLANRP